MMSMESVVQNKTEPYYPDESDRAEKAKRWIRQARGEEPPQQSFLDTEAAPE